MYLCDTSFERDKDSCTLWWRCHRPHLYSGNEATRFTVARTAGTSLLTSLLIIAVPTWSCLSSHSHSYRRARKAGQTTLEQAQPVLSTSRIS